MKLLFYSPVKLRNGGGCERWHCDVTQSLAKEFKHRVTIVTSNLGDNKWSAEYLTSQLKDIPYVRLDDWTILGVAVPKPTSIIRLYKMMAEADVVHFIHGFAGQDLLVLGLKLLLKKRVVAGHHAPILHKIGFHNWYMSNISRRLLNFFDGHMTLNLRDKQFLENQWRIRGVKFIPSGIRLDKFLVIKRPRRHNLGFVTVGIYRLQKGLDLLMQAIEEFNRILPNNKAIFRLVGGGELKDTVTTHVAKNHNIIDLGYLKYEEMPGVYQQSDVYLLPSREEPFGLVLIEAWASGMPVLATKTEGPSDMLIEGKNGWFISEINSLAICDALVKLYNKWMHTPKERLFSEQLCRVTGSKFSIDTTAKRMNNELFLS